MPRHRRGAGPDAEAERSERSPAAKRGGRLLKVALLGGALGLLVRDDVRGRVLDVLFGAEEEFDYHSVTEPVLPGSDAVAAAAAADASPPVAGEDGQAAGDQAGGLRAVAPSPAAWRHAPDEQPATEADPDVNDPAAAEPPAPPRDWWTPGEGAGSATDG
jgi:hypothetical protein